VITGGSGFIGSHLCERFLADGHEVVCVDNYLTGSPKNTDHLVDRPKFTRLESNVSERLPVEGSFDRLLHFASPASPVHYMRYAIETLKVGSDAVFNCAELARRQGARLLVASTSEIYGDPLEHPQRESYWGNVNTIGPRSVYDEAKRFMESITMAFHREYGLETRIVRIFNTYGPRMQLDDGRALPNFCAQAIRGEPITIYGDGSQTRSFCYVDDLVEGIVRLLESDCDQPVNLGNPDEITIREMVDEVLELTGSNSRIVHCELPQDDPKIRCPDIRRAREILGWEPKVTRRVGFQRTIAYFRSVLEPAS